MCVCVRRLSECGPCVCSTQPSFSCYVSQAPGQEGTSTEQIQHVAVPNSLCNRALVCKVAAQTFPDKSKKTECEQMEPSYR